MARIIARSRSGSKAADRSQGLARGASTGAATASEGVLADVQHELGNYFHKLYYWSDFLQERGTKRSEDTTATQMLASTIRNLEGFLKLVLDYVHPLQLSFVRMNAAEVLAGIETQMRMQDDTIPIAVEGDVDGGVIAVDPARFSQVVALVARRLLELRTQCSRLEVRAECRLSAGRTEMNVRAALSPLGTGASLFRAVGADLEWALAERIVALHGGELRMSEPSAEQAVVTLFVPFAEA